jgi:hypothetical protein
VQKIGQLSIIISPLNKASKVGTHSWATWYENEHFGENAQISAIKKLKFCENFIIASATYG